MFEEPDGATPLGPDEIGGLKFKHITTRGELDELEQANIQQGMLWLFARKRGDICEEDFIRVVHRRLFADVWDWAGTFRQRGPVRTKWVQNGKIFRRTVLPV